MEPVGQPFKLPNLCEMAQHPVNLRRGHRQLPRRPRHVRRPRRTLRGYLHKAAFDLLAISVPCRSSLVTERGCLLRTGQRRHAHAPSVGTRRWHGWILVQRTAKLHGRTS
jgi:hypothetical protein